MGPGATRWERPFRPLRLLPRLSAPRLQKIQLKPTKGSAPVARVPTSDARDEVERQGSRKPTTQELAGNGHPDDADHADEPPIPWDELDIGTHDRTVYRMSSLGGDLSALVAGAMGYEGTMPAWLQGYLDEGTAMESVILERFHEEFAKRAASYPELVTLKNEGVIAGYNPGEQQVQVWLEVGTRALVRGHTDEICRINPKSERSAFAVVEVKKLRPSTWAEWTAAKVGVKKGAYVTPFEHTDLFEKYAWQVSALRWATNLPVYFVVGEYNPETKGIDSIDALLISEENVPHSLAEIKARVMRAQKHVLANDVPMCEFNDESCMYAAFDFCPGKLEKAAEDVDDVELGRLLALYHAYTVDMQKTEDQLEAEKLRKKVKEDIDKHIANAGLKRTADDESGLMRVWSPTGDEFEFEWVTYPVRARGATSANKINLKLIVEGVAVDGAEGE